MVLLPKIKLKTLPTFPSVIYGGAGIEVIPQNGALTVALDYSDFGAVSAIPTSPTSYVLTYDTFSQAYVMVPSHLLGGAVSGIADVPIDSNLYGRGSAGGTGVWKIIPPGGFPDVPLDANLYVRGTVSGAQAWIIMPPSGPSAVVEQVITAPGPATINANTSVVRVNQTVGAPITLNMGLASAKTVPVLISDWKGDAGTNNITVALSGSDKFPGGLTNWKIASDTGSLFLRPTSGGYAL